MLNHVKIKAKESQRKCNSGWNSVDAAGVQGVMFYGGDVNYTAEANIVYDSAGTKLMNDAA